MEIGFVGLGTMGFHMARRLIEAGHQLVVCDARPEAVARVTALGAVAASSPREVADRVDLVNLAYDPIFVHRLSFLKVRT